MWVFAGSHTDFWTGANHHPLWSLGKWASCGFAVKLTWEDAHEAPAQWSLWRVLRAVFAGQSAAALGRFRLLPLSSCVNGTIPAPAPLEILVLSPVFFPTITVALSLVVCGSAFTHGNIILLDAWGQQGSLSHPAEKVNNENRPHQRTAVLII